jgi:hypothetical protein
MIVFILVVVLMSYAAEASADRIKVFVNDRLIFEGEISLSVSIVPGPPVPVSAPVTPQRRRVFDR